MRNNMIIGIFGKNLEKKMSRQFSEIFTKASKILRKILGYRENSFGRIKELFWEILRKTL